MLKERNEALGEVETTDTFLLTDTNAWKWTIF